MARSRSVELVLDCTDVDKARVRNQIGEFIEMEAGVPFKVSAKDANYLTEHSRLARYIIPTEGWEPKLRETRADTTRGTSDITELKETRNDETRGTSNQYVHAPETRLDETRGLITSERFNANTGVTHVEDTVVDEPEVELVEEEPEVESDPDEE